MGAGILVEGEDKKMMWLFAALFMVEDDDFFRGPSTLMKKMKVRLLRGKGQQAFFLGWILDYRALTTFLRYMPWSPVPGDNLQVPSVYHLL